MKHELSADIIKQTIGAIQAAVIATGKTDLIALHAYWLNVQMAQQYVKPEPELKVLIEIDGGNIQYIYATENINITVIDKDNMEQGDIELEEDNYPFDVVEPGTIENRIAEVYNDYHV